LFKGYFPNGKTLLDVGCGIGNDLILYREKGFECTGIDFSIRGCEIARERGLTVLQGDLSEHVDSITPKDFIQAHGVMEHVHEPMKFMQSLKRIMAPGKSVLLISVPNDFSPLQRRAMERYKYPPYFVSFPDHLNYFNVESFKRVLKAAEFKILELFCDFPMELFLLFKRDYVSDPTVGKQCHQERVAFEESFDGEEEALLKIYKGFASLGIGRFVYALVQC